VPYKLDFILIVVTLEPTNFTAPTLEPKLILPIVVDEYLETNVPLTNLPLLVKELNELNSTSFLPDFSSNFTRETNILRAQHSHVIKGLFNKPLN